MSTRRAWLRGTAVALPATLAAACGAPAGPAAGTSQQAAPGGTVKGKVLVMSYQTTSPRLDWQTAMYDDLNKELRPKGLEAEFVNPGVPVIEKVTAMHVAGTPADMWEQRVRARLVATGKWLS